MQEITHTRAPASYNGSPSYLNEDLASTAMLGHVTVNVTLHTHVQIHAHVHVHARANVFAYECIQCTCCNPT